MRTLRIHTGTRDTFFQEVSRRLARQVLILMSSENPPLLGTNGVFLMSPRSVSLSIVFSQFRHDLLAFLWFSIRVLSIYFKMISCNTPLLLLAWLHNCTAVGADPDQNGGKSTKIRPGILQDLRLKSEARWRGGWTQLDYIFWMMCQRAMPEV